MRKSTAILKTWEPKLIWAACAGLFLFHLFVIWKYAVNIPFNDDWVMFLEDHPANLSLEWLHAQHNEHRLAVTKFFIWLQFHLDGWNVVTSLLFNFFIYGLLLAWVVWMVRRAAPQLPAWVMPGFILFLLAPLLWFNHFMVTQSSIHFYLFFFFVAAYFLFSENQRWRNLLIGCAAATLSIYSFGAGVVACLILLIAFGVFKSLRAYSAALKGERARELKQLALVAVLIGGALVTWTIGYVKPPYHPPLTYPDSLMFRRVFLNYVSTGFGIDRLSSAWGALCLLLTLAPVCAIVWRQKGRLTGAQWISITIVVCLLCILATAAMTRAGFGIGVSKGYQYTEHPLFLLPFTVLNWALFLQHRAKLKTGFFIGLWFFCLAMFADNWDFSVYRTESAKRMEGVACIKAYYERRGDGLCPTVFPALKVFPLLLDNAKRLNASSYQSLHVHNDN